MTALLATIGAALFGGADFLGGLASRRAPAQRVTALSQALGLPVIALALAVAPFAGTPSREALGFGALAGLCGGVGVVSLYAALATGRMSVVAPTTAALGAALPTVFGIVRGEVPGPVAIVGIVLAIVAIVIVSLTPDTEVPAPGAAGPGGVGRATLLSLLAGVGFSGSVISFSFTGSESGLWPLSTARIASTLLVTVLALAATRGLKMPRPALTGAAWAGALDIFANFSMIVAIQRGPIAVAAVLGSLYPVVTVLLARGFLGERLRGVQRVGVALALVAVVLVAVG